MLILFCCLDPYSNLSDSTFFIPSDLYKVSCQRDLSKTQIVACHLCALNPLMASVTIGILLAIAHQEFTGCTLPCTPLFGLGPLHFALSVIPVFTSPPLWLILTDYQCKCHFLREVLTDSPIWIMSLVTVTITLLFLSFVTATVNYHFSLVFIFGVFKRNISNIHRPFLENNITHILHLTLSYLNIFVLFVTDLF